ncbi:MAG: tRNA pseudouridine(38-40) synthase TruA [Thermoleophilia bacterium]
MSRSIYRMDLQYDGRPFRGWSAQPGLPTVEGSLQQAFSVVLREVPTMTVAGRTDAGVHARRQVVSLDLPAPVEAERLIASLNALTPPEISVRGLLSSPGFDARADAVTRSYRYFLWQDKVESPFWRRYSWFRRRPLDVDAMNRAASHLLGRHDLTAFTPTETEHVLFHRTVQRCRWRRRGSFLWLDIEAPAFLRHMVRILVGTMVEVGEGSRSPDDLARLVEGAPRDQAGPTAPPHGLFLWRIRYAPREARS